MLEIGVDRGGSISGWQEFFGRDQLKYYGLDINPACKQLEGPGVTIFIGDQADEVCLNDMVCNLPLQVVFDDGGHIARQQVAGFEALFPKLICGGIYIVEDTHTSFWSDYRSELTLGSERKHVGAIDYFCRLTHEIMERWWDFGSRARFNLPRQNRALPSECKYAQTIYGISFYDSMVVIERGEVQEPRRIRRK